MSGGNKYIVGLSLLISLVLAVWPVAADLDVSITPGMVNVNPGETGYATADADGAGSSGSIVFIWEVKKSTDNWTTWSSPDSGEIVVVFTDSGTTSTTADVDGKAEIEISVAPGAVSGTQYRYLVVVGSSETYGFAAATADVTAIPEFSTVMIPTLMALGGYMAMRIRRRKD